jgi:hypothetical protein
MPTPKKSAALQDAQRTLVQHALAHLDHVLPAQAPILDFVHHNTIHGFQHLAFEQALVDYETLTGTRCYLPEEKFREYYQQGRITDHDLTVAFKQTENPHLDQSIFSKDERSISRQDIYRCAMLFDIQAIPVSQLNWQIEEMRALTKVQSDVPKSARLAFLDSAKEADVVKQLWASILNKLGMQQAAMHPEELLDLSKEQVESWLDSSELLANDLTIHQQMQTHASAELEQLLAQVGVHITLRGFLLSLTGTDILDSIRPLMIRICASCLDEGIAAWQMPERSQRGLYATWRALAQYDANLFLIDFRDQQGILNIAPEDAIDAIVLHLTHMEIPEPQWQGYLEQLALEIPGWAGMINWREQHPNYRADNKANATLADFLAIRLTMDALWLNQLFREIWKIDAKISSISGYFKKNLSEFLVRQLAYQGKLPEYLTLQAINLTTSAGSERNNRSEWQQLADLFWTWQFSPASPNQTGFCRFDAGWRLFRLCQHLGINALWIHHLQKEDLLQLLVILDELTPEQRNKIWLNAYEHHYREDLFQALRANYQRGRWFQREQRPTAQVIFCMDDREEGFRRHLEEKNPSIETLGAAGFFGVAMNYQGLDEMYATALCPVVVTPQHDVIEQPRPNNAGKIGRYTFSRKLGLKLNNLLHHQLRRNVLTSEIAINALAPVTLLNLLAKIALPQSQHNFLTSVKSVFTPKIQTELHYAATNPVLKTVNLTQLGFTDQEQADRVAGFLRNTGLSYGFAPIVVLMGHGSYSQNNPHLAAYDCGACSGRHGGPNARVFAAMANRPEIRQLLLEKGIEIPAETWFIGAEHNTCNEQITWFDADLLPEGHLRIYSKLQEELSHAQKLSAHERCRRLASAPRKPSPTNALIHIKERAVDFSQVRPELGHATNASAVVGRRALTQGAFFDRRVFLISYDPTQDADGNILEGILLAVGPVGAGINLEYYFSTVNNERFGCGSKVPHNVTGFFGIMEGASSDLRTGLPQQMVEIHEAMRLQLVVEAKTAVLEAIYERQESLRELISGGWLHLSTMDPETGEISTFERGKGFASWQADIQTPAFYDSSPECYKNQTEPVPPALIKQPEFLEY